MTEAPPPKWPTKGPATQEEIARLAGISPAHLSNILNGRAVPAWKTARRLGGILRCSPVIFVERNTFLMAIAFAAYRYSRSPDHETD